MLSSDVGHCAAEATGVPQHFATATAPRPSHGPRCALKQANVGTPHRQRGQGRQPRRVRRHQQAARHDRVGVTAPRIRAIVRRHADTTGPCPAGDTRRARAPVRRHGQPARLPRPPRPDHDRARRRLFRPAAAPSPGRLSRRQWHLPSDRPRRARIPFRRPCSRDALAAAPGRRSRHTHRNRGPRRLPRPRPGQAA